jgi:hypothetical protein
MEDAMRTAVSHPNAPVTMISTASSVAWITLAGLRLRPWIEARAARAADAALYWELSKLSDMELERRGIPRGALHRCDSGDMDDSAGQRSRF